MWLAAAAVVLGGVAVAVQAPINTAVWGVASLGVVTMVAALILGQMAAAMAMDATGALGMAMRKISPTRIAAAGVVTAGLRLSRV